MKTFITCCKCECKYHPSCILKIGGICTDDSGNLFCCGNITSKECNCEEKDREILELKSRLLNLNEVIFENSIRQYSSVDAGIEECTQNFADTRQEEQAETAELEVEVDLVKPRTSIEFSNVLIKEKITLIGELYDKIEVLKRYNALLEKNLYAVMPSTNIVANYSLENPRSDMTIPAVREITGESPEKQNIAVDLNLNERSITHDVENFKKVNRKDKRPDKTTISGKDARQHMGHDGLNNTKSKGESRVNDRSAVQNTIRNIHNNKADISTENCEFRSTNRIRNPKNRKESGNQIIRGTRTDEKNHPTFSSVRQRIWLHIGRVQPNTTEDDIQKHLNGIFPGRVFVIEALKRGETASSIAFKIGGDSDLMEQLYESENWPNGVTIRRFTFFRGNAASS